MPFTRFVPRARLAGAIVLPFLPLVTDAAAEARAARSGAVTHPAADSVGRSPWGAADEIGTLNMMTDASRARILSRIAGGTSYDLAVEYFAGMPSWYLAGDPLYQLWMTHTPRGHAIDDPLNVGAAQNATVAYTGDAISMHTHTGTHIDALNHFGLHGEVYNGYAADEHLGDRGWTNTGVERFPPIIARGALIDVAAYKGMTMLPDSYSITRPICRGRCAGRGRGSSRATWCSCAGGA